MTVDRWTGRETRLLRHALRLTVRHFAEDLGVSPRTISKWESAGATRTPRPELQAALDTMLDRATDAERSRFLASVGLASEQPETSPPSRPAPTEAAPSPAPAVPLGLVGGLPHMSVGQLRQVSRLVDDARGHVEPELVPYFAARIEDCQTQDGSQGPVQALPSTLSVIAAVDAMARAVSLPVRRQLLTLAARAAEFVGWLYRDAGALDQATYWYDRATEWAQEAHNPAMQGYVLLRKSQLAYDTRDPIRVLSLAEAAEYGPWQLPPDVRAEVAQQQALGLGMLGSPLDVVERQLDEAWTRLGQVVPDNERSHLLGGATLAEGTLRLRSAACYHEAGDTARAADRFGRVLEDGSLSRRDAAYFTARRAAAFAAGGDPDSAADLALQSVEVATSAQSRRTLRVLTDVAEVLSRWDDRPAVRALREAVGA
jgi:transcriptional regulator with XRE-family HTH domain